MQPIYLIYVLTLFLITLGSLFLLIYIRRYWDLPEAWPFSLLMGCVAWWAFWAACSTMVSSQEVAITLGIPFRFTGVILTPLSSLLFSLVYNGYKEWLTRRRLLALSIIPAISLLLNWTSAHHSLFVYDVVYEQIGGIWLRTAWRQGLWFQYIYVPYSVISLGLAVFFFIRQIRHIKYPYRQQAYLILFGAILPLIAGLVTTYDLVPGPDLDLIVLSFLVTGVAFAWALSQYHLLNYSPIARSTIFENMTEAIMVMDNHDRVVEMNPAFYNRMGLTREQAVGLTLEQIFSNWPDLVKRYKGMREGQMVVTIPTPERKAYLDIKVTEIRDKKNKQVGRLVVWRDITKLKEIELALEASLQRVALLLKMAGSLNDFTKLEDLFETTVNRAAWALPADRVALVVFNEDKTEISHYVGGGPGATNIQQVTFTELMEGLTGWVLRESKPALSLKGEPDARESESVRQRRQETNCGSIIVVPLLYQEQVLGTMTVINKPEERDFNWNDVELMQAMASQTAVAIVNTRLYIAQREQLQALQESNEALEAFSYMVAHDLKGPLGVVVNYAELALAVADEDKMNRERMLKYFGTIARTGFKMAGIISDLLLLAKIRREEEVPLEYLDMNIIINEVLARLNWQIEEEEAQINMPPRWPNVVGYAPWVEEIWANYISNAIKYGGDCPVIELGYEEVNPQPNGHIRFWVQDSGEGMTAEEQQQLFIEFSRVGERRIKGHGLGLSIVRRIAERMGGTVGVESEPDVGSVFYFTLPKLEE